jgi:hypothetical protein
MGELERWVWQIQSFERRRVAVNLCADGVRHILEPGAHAGLQSKLLR